MKYRIILGGALCFLLAACARYTDQVEKSTLPASSSISPALANPLAKVLKRKVAIARFSNETKYSKGFFYDGQNDLVGKQASDILAARLTESEKFILFERSDLAAVNAELAMADMEKLKVNADYLIVGSVSEFGRKESSKTGVFTRTKSQVAYAKVNVRLIDVYNGEIIYSQEGEGEALSEAGTVMGIGDRAGYDATLNDKAISAAISKLVSNIISNLMERPWRSYILSYENGTFIISGGKSQGLGAGDVFTVFKKGSKVKNPQTGMMIELPGTPAGKIKVSALAGNTQQNEVSMCVRESGEVPTDNFDKYYIEESK
jgi:curli biogenesis system outer membrane secretion channel CsgG